MTSEARKIGRPTRQGEVVSTGMRLPVALHARLVEAAQDRDLAVNWLVVRAITQFLDHLIPVDEIQWTREEEPRPPLGRTPETPQETR